AGYRGREVAGWGDSHRGRRGVSKIVRASCAGAGAFCPSLYADPLLPDAGEESDALFLSGARDDDGLRGCSSAVPTGKKSSGGSDVHETVARGVFAGFPARVGAEVAIRFAGGLAGPELRARARAREHLGIPVVSLRYTEKKQ